MHDTRTLWESQGSHANWSISTVAVRDRIRLRRVQTQAEGYLELGMPQHALDVLTRLGDLSNFNSHALCLWGEALQTMDRFADALIPLSRAAKLAPDNIHIWLAMGWCHKRTGDIDLAIEDLEEALAVDSSEAIIHYNLSCYLCLVGDKSRALFHLGEALAIDPEYRDLIEKEKDFDSIRSDPEFLQLVKIIV
ncbi:MAG: hypothetical protein JXM70_27435 [Pirellulales bacterium]|nr:hypothetical protein [Pirellulales bacterium]